MEFSFSLSAGNLKFVVDEAAVQQVLPKIFTSSPLLYIACHQGLVEQAAVRGTESHLTTAAGTAGCSNRY
jgi:hypothetical protein